MNAEKAAEILVNCATLLELYGANRHRIARYRFAAQVMLRLGDLAPQAAQNPEALRALGFGERLSRKLHELFTTEHLSFYEDLLSDLPYGVVRLMQIQGIGPKLAFRLYNELGVSSPTALAEAARRGEVHLLKGFGPRRDASYAAYGRPVPVPPAPQAAPPDGQLAFDFLKAA
jgi:DNA polymerase (family X)